MSEEAVYQRYFGLDSPPFSITPDPRFVFLSPHHEDALAHLRYGIGQGGGGGFVQITGEVGTGKTTLCRLLLEDLPASARVALILNPKLEPIELLETLCDELGISTRGARSSGKRLLDRLNRYLLDAHAEGLTVVLIIDEAQNLSTEALEQVRLLTNLETATQKLLQIVLLGQPELRDQLARSDLRQLAQRITARYHLDALSLEQTAAYVGHRLEVAGCARMPFTRSAIRELQRHSRGVPRLINILAERSLLAGYALDQRSIDARIVRRAAREVLGREGRRPRWRLAALGAATLAFAGVGAWQLWPGAGEDPVEPAGTAAEAATVTAEPIQPPEPVSVAETPDRPPPSEPDPPEPELDDPASAWSMLLERRDMDPAVLDGEVPSCRAPLRPGLFCIEGRGTLSHVRQLERPVLVQLPFSKDGGYAVLEAVDGELRLSTRSGSTPVDRTQLESWWNGRYWDAWTMPGYMAELVREGDRGPAVLWLKSVASRAAPAYAGDADDPYFGPSLKQWIIGFQEHTGLRADGLVGPETLQFLSRYAHDNGS